MSDNNKNGIITILIVIIFGLFAFSIYNHTKQSKKNDTLTEEKKTIFNQLNDLEKRYDIAIDEKTKLSGELEAQKNNIIKFRDSLKKIKNTNWKLITFYKNKIKSLTNTTEKMILINDSLVKINMLLNNDNRDLITQKEVLTNNLKRQTNYNDTLVNQNLDLAKKVAIGAIIRANNFGVTTYNEKRNGNFKKSDKARRVNTFKISFLLNENQLAKSKDIIAFIVIKDPNGNIVSNKGKFKTETNRIIYFSDRTVIPYKTFALSTDVIIKSNKKLEKGDYTIITYLDNKKVSVLKKTLN